jgi:DNA repair protein RecN (Recombination protein N)
VMLAIEVVLAGDQRPPVFVFDEVDAGIGGRAAVHVGQRLAALASSAQVIVVTHLPQVAAFADQHIVVRKQADGMITSVVRLSDDQRRAELARMMAGRDDSESALAHADELIDLAAAERNGRAAVG